MPLEPDSDVYARGHALPPPLAYSNGGLGAAWVHVGSELDIATTPQVKRTLDAVRARPAVLDVRKLAFIDSCGMNAIVGAGGRARQAGRRLVLVGGPPVHISENGAVQETVTSRDIRHDPVDRGARKGSTSWRP